MLQHYFTLAYRVLLRNKFFTLINISGLSLALSAAFFIFNYINTELSYDRFHLNAEHLYRVNMEFKKEGNVQSKSARVSPVVGSILKENNPSIEEICRMVILGPDGILSNENKSAAVRNVFLADNAFFKLFSFPLKEGDINTVLTKPFTIMISASVAEQLFGDVSPIGKTISVNAENFEGSAPFEVSGVFEDLPSNTHLAPGVLIAYPTLFEFVGHQFDESWAWNETYTYVKFDKNLSEPAINAIAAYKALNEKAKEQNAEQWSNQKTSWQYSLQAVPDIHLTEGISHEITPSGSRNAIWFLGAVGIFILIIAYINFVNLAVVKSFNRMKEVGVRKVAGANRIQLLIQFLMENALLNVIAFVSATCLVFILDDTLYSYFEIIPIRLSETSFSLAFAGLTIFLVLLLSSSLYLGWIIAAFKPASIMKNGNATNKGIGFKTGLIVLQFTISTLFMIATFFIHQQLQFMKQAETGMDLEQIVVMNAPKVGEYPYDNNFQQFSIEANRLADVVNVAGAGLVPGEEIYMYNDQVNVNEQAVEGVFKTLRVSASFFEQYGIKLLAGQFFVKPQRGKQIINATAAKALGFDKAEDAIGARTSLGEIVGVVADHHHESLHTAIPPTMYSCVNNFNYYSVKFNTAQSSETIQAIEATYKKLFPGSPFEWFFVDEFYQRQYQAEQQFASMFAFFASLVIFIACLGFLALTGYSISRRTKEIGIRKTFGASNQQIMLLLTSKFIQYIVIAILLAIPLANYLLGEWLDNYAYHIEINWWLFAIPCLLVVLIALATVSFQSFKAANINPAETVREA